MRNTTRISSATTIPIIISRSSAAGTAGVVIRITMTDPNITVHMATSSAIHKLPEGHIRIASRIITISLIPITLTGIATCMVHGPPIPEIHDQLHIIHDLTMLTGRLRIQHSSKDIIIVGIGHIRLRNHKESIANMEEVGKNKRNLI